MIDREYSQITVTVPPRFNRTRLLSEGIVIRQAQEASYNLGITELQTNFGNTVRVYDVEKTICDLVKLRGKIEVQHYQTAIKSYMRRKDKDLTRLLKYAETLKIRDEILHKADYLCVIPKMNIMIFILFISENPAKVLIWKLEGIQKEKYSGG